MPTRLKLTKNAQFFKLRENLDVEKAIASILNSAAENISESNEFVIDVARLKRATPSGLSYTLSVRVFESSRPVHFIDEEVDDSIFAFIAIIEIEDYVAVLRKSCANISDKLDEFFDLVQGPQLTGTFDDDSVEYQKIALRNMTISDRAMRARSYEAVDLKGLFSTHAAGRSIPYFLKIRDGGILRTFSTTSGRLVEASERKSVDEIAEWANQQIALLKKPAAQKTFLDSFAKLVSLDEVMNATEPTAVLVEAGVLTDRLNNNDITIHHVNKSGNLVPASEVRLQRLISSLEQVYNIDASLNILGAGKGARIRRNAKSLTLHIPDLKNFKVEEYGKTDSLLKYLTKHGLYSICFADPKYMYFMGGCFEDRSGVAEIDSILEILQPKPLLATVTSEKGTVATTSTTFSPNCVFSAVENIHATDDYIFCDDLGLEWADHITLNGTDACITFIHSKHGDPSLSASKMHEVVGQGVKNLGYMFFSKAQISKKIQDKFSANYVLDSTATTISRTRKGNVANFDPFFATLVRDFRLHRKCVLACSFLSKTSVTTEFEKIKLGQRVDGWVVQLLWIISSFAHAARDANVVPLIYCRD